MPLLDTYNAFRSNPKAESLSSDATCAYISSGVYFNSCAKVLQHFHTNVHEIETISETILSTHETESSLVLETDTCVKFVRGPGALLPGLSMNFVADEQASIYLIHIVNFDQDHKITSIKYTWDQATLLKQVSVIGSRGNAWPIYAGKDQVLLSQGKPIVTTRLLKDDPATSTASSMRSWPAASKVFQSQPMEQVPVPAPAIEAPSPSFRPQHRNFLDIVSPSAGESPRVRRQNLQPRARPQSAYMSLFGAASSEEYKRMVAGSAGFEEEKENVQ